MADLAARVAARLNELSLTGSCDLDTMRVDAPFGDVLTAVRDVLGLREPGPHCPRCGADRETTEWGWCRPCSDAEGWSA